MEFRKATSDDFSTVITLYTLAILHLDNQGIHQRDSSYPSESILKEDIQKQEMYLGIIGQQIAVAFTLNSNFDNEYLLGKWRYPNLPFLVLHRFCVHPNYQHKGMGVQTLVYIESILKNQEYQVLRLDAFSKNPFSLKLYEKSGFSKVGQVYFSKGLFYLYEKKL